MTYNIALVKGDGIGPEIVDSAVQVLEKVGQRFNHVFYFTEYLAGGCAIDATGVPLPEETVKGCLASDSVLLGAAAWAAQCSGALYKSASREALSRAESGVSIATGYRGPGI